MNNRCKSSIRIFSLLIIFHVITAGVGLGGSVFAENNPIIFQVNSVVDSQDVNLGDGICEDVNGNCTLRAAIEEANAYTGSEQIQIQLPEGTYSPAYPLGQYTLEGNVSIVGAGEDKTIIDFSTVTSRIFDIDKDAEVSISGVTITGGRAYSYNPYGENSGGAIRNKGALSLYEVTITKSDSYFGGNAISNETGSTLTIENSTIRENGLSPGNAHSGGGIRLVEDSSLTLINSSVTNNISWSGGGIYNKSGTVVIEGSTISGNEAIGAYGGILSEGSLTLKNSVVSENIASSDGGGISFGFNGGELNIESSDIINNSAENGAGIFVGVHKQSSATSSLSVIDSHISGNQASNDGGGVYIGMDSSGEIVSLENNHIVGNIAGNKGADVSNASTIPVQAKHNWWGSSGPTGKLEGEALVFPWWLNEEMSEQAGAAFLLDRLTVQSETMIPTFSPEINLYKLNPTEAVELELSGVVADSELSLSINGNTAVSGEVTSIPLEIGANTIEVMVTTKDGWTNVYTLEVSRVLKSFVVDKEYSGYYTPTALTVGPDGQVYYTSFDYKIVNRLDSSLENETSLATGFNRPWGIAVDADGYIYVADFGSYHLIKLSADGTEIERIGGYGTDDGQLNRPKGLAIDNNGHIYVADSQNKRIQIFDTNLEYVSEFTDADWYPYLEDVAVSQDGFIYVVYNYGEERIVKFDKNGNKIYSWGEQGSGNGQFNNPKGIAVDNDGYVYVADQDNNRVQIFDSNGTYLASIEGFKKPSSVAFDAEGNLYVARENGITKLRVQSNNATLKNLHTSEGDLEPEFTPNQTDYAIEVDDSVEKLNLTPEVNDPKSVIIISGTQYNSGQPIEIELEIGPNTITIQVQAENGLALNYVVVINRKDSQEPTWPTDSKLAVTDTTRTSVKMSWPEATDNIAVEGYRIYVNGHLIETLAIVITEYDVLNLTANTTYKLSVEAFDTSGNMSVKLTKEIKTLQNPSGGGGWMPSNNANLRQLELLTGDEILALTPAFSSDITEYFMQTELTEIHLVAKVDDSAGKLMVNGRVVERDLTLELIPGKNIFELVVEAANGAEKTYTLTITRTNLILFTDIDRHWAEEFIQQATAAGIIKGYPDGTFKPNTPMTRMHAISLLVRALGLESDEPAPFGDIGNHAAETQAEINAAYKYGLVKGQNGNLMPSKNVTRAQIALMLKRAYEYQTGTKYIVKTKAPFPDIENYDEETVNAITMLYELSIAEGSNGNYMPNDSTTRGHAAKMFVNFMENLK